MGLATDWNIYKNNAAMSALIHTGSSLIHGNGSLELGYVSAGANINMIRKNTPKRFTSGRARFLLGHTVPGSQLTGNRPGFLFNTSQEDLTGGAGTGYYFALLKTGGTNQFTPDFRRISAGMGTSTALTTGSAFTLAVAPQSVPVEVTWRLDVENLGGMVLSCRRGVVADYRGVSLSWETLLTVAVITGYLDTGYLVSSQGEGPAFRDASTSQDRYYFDQMSVVPLLVGGVTS